MKKYIYLILILLLTILNSCEKTIEFKGEISQPLLVVNSFVVPNENIKVTLTQSRFFLYHNDSKFKNVSDAKVQLLVNGEFKEELALKKSTYLDWYDREEEEEYYLSEYKPKAGDKLQIKASSPKFDEVESEEVIVPGGLEISSIKTFNYKWELLEEESWDYYEEVYYANAIDDADEEEDNEDGDEDGEDKEDNENGEDEEIYESRNLKEDLDLNFDFQDEAGVNNFYILEIMHEKELADGSKFTEYLHYQEEDVGDYDDYNYGYYYGNYNYFVINNNIFHQSLEIGLFDTFYDGNYYFIFDDALFDGEKITFDISMNLYYFGIHELNPLVDNKLIIRMYHLSKDYYLYKKTLDAYNSSFGSMFTEPVQIYSNIKGGIGIFAGKNISEYVIDLPIDLK